LVETLLATIVGFSVGFLFCISEIAGSCPGYPVWRNGYCGYFFGICSSKSLTWTL